MKKTTLTLFPAFVFYSIISSAQLTPVIDWEIYSPATPEASGISMGMDFTGDEELIDFFNHSYGLTTINSDGTINLFCDDMTIAELITSPPVVKNRGTYSYIYYCDSNLHVLHILSADNFTGTVFHDVELDIPLNYSQITIVDADVIVADDSSFHGILMKTFDNTVGKWKALFAGVCYYDLGDNATHVFIPVLVGSWATFPSSLVADQGSPDRSFYIWGFYNKDIAGTNHDNFITKVHNDGEVFGAIYNKSHYSYTGKDDVAGEIEVDGSGNVYALSCSDDNSPPGGFSHIAVFKINPVNGKRMWLRRIGEGMTGDEFAFGLAASSTATGIALTGSISDGVGGRNARTWRLDNSGNTMWVKTINMTPGGTAEEGRKVGFCPASGDVNVTGFRSSTDTYFMARYNNTTGAPAWPLEVYDGPYSGGILPFLEQDFSATGDIYVGYIVQTDTGAGVVATKYEQIVLKEDENTVENKFEIVPNPSDEFIIIKGAGMNAIVKLINSNGAIVMEQIITSESYRIGINHLPSGFYSCAIYSGNDVQFASFVKAN